MSRLRSALKRNPSLMHVTEQTVNQAQERYDGCVTLTIGRSTRGIKPGTPLASGKIAALPG